MTVTPITAFAFVQQLLLLKQLKVVLHPSTPQGTWQRVFTAKTPKVVRWGLGIVAVLVAIITKDVVAALTIAYDILVGGLMVAPARPSSGLVSDARRRRHPFAGKAPPPSFTSA